MTLQHLWLWEHDPLVLDKFRMAFVRNWESGVLNEDEISRAEIAERMRLRTNRYLPISPDAPELQLLMPKQDIAPDYFSLGRFKFASSRLREALAQPPDVIQFVPITIDRAGPKVQAQRYMRMHILAAQPALDVDRSDCRTEDSLSGLTGETYRSVQFIQRYALYEDLQPQTEVFRIEESRTDILVADALALRVLRAGCKGLRFYDPTDDQNGMHIRHYRTLDGVGEVRVGF